MGPWGNFGPLRYSRGMCVWRCRSIDTILPAAARALKSAGNLTKGVRRDAWNTLKCLILMALPTGFEPVY